MLYPPSPRSSSGPTVPAESDTPATAHAQGAGPQDRGPSLDPATSFDADPSRPAVLRGSAVGRVALSGFSGAGEYSIYPAGLGRTSARTSRKGEGRDPDRARAESARRSTSTLRRYCVTNRLRFLWTCTYRPEDLPADRAGVWRDVARLRRRLAVVLGHSVPLAAVIEEGSRTGRLHVHFLVGERIPVQVVERAWGAGFVFVAPPRKTPGLGGRARLRVTAAYLTKYVGKGFGDVGGARYSVTHGFSETRRQLAHYRTYSDALAAVLELGPVDSVWTSEGVEDWPGPLVWCIRLE